jgi:predicted RNA-binding protein YlxR (DUF448 family)
VRDDRGRLGGRGLYVCATFECFDRAVQRRSFSRAARLQGEGLVIEPNLGSDLGTTLYEGE